MKTATLLSVGVTLIAASASDAFVTQSGMGSGSAPFVGGVALGRQPRHGTVATSTRKSSLSMSIVPATIKVNDIVYSRTIVIFGVSDCPHTNRVENLLDSAYAQYTSVYLDQIDDGPDMMDAITSMTGRTQTPCVYVEGKFIGGQDHIIAKNLDGQLGRMLVEVGAVPEDRMRQLKHSWYQPHKPGLSIDPDLFSMT